MMGKSHHPSSLIQYGSLISEVVIVVQIVKCTQVNWCLTKLDDCLGELSVFYCLNMYSIYVLYFLCCLQVSLNEIS